jgi:hypothetical protein
MLVVALRNLLAPFFHRDMFRVEGCQPLINSLIVNGCHSGCIFNLSLPNFESTFSHISIMGSFKYNTGG